MFDTPVYTHKVKLSKYMNASHARGMRENLFTAYLPHPFSVVSPP